MYTPRRTKSIFGLTLLLLLTWSKEARLSGAMSASAVSRQYAISISELSYPIGSNVQMTAAELAADERSWRTRLGEVMTVTDKWLAIKTKEGRLLPVELALGTALVESPLPLQAGGPLARPALIALPPCLLAARNLGVVVRVALKVLPAPTERTALGQSLCAFITAAASEPQEAQPIALVSPIRLDHEPLALALNGDFNVPANYLPTVNKLRADFFKQAADVMQRSYRRFEKRHPGVTLRRIVGLGSKAVRFYMDAPFGGFDLLTEFVVAPGVPEPSGVELKDTLYEDWRAAGLPMQVELPTLLKPASP